MLCKVSLRMTHQNAAPLTVAVVGAGALGQFYAAQLSYAGHRLKLLARRDMAVLTKRGIVVHQTPTSKIKTSLETQLIEIRPEQIEVATSPEQLASHSFPDWVLVSLKTTALTQAQALVAPLVGPHTRVAVMCNGLGVEDHFAEWFGPERVFGLLCFVGVNRLDDGTIHHLAFGHVAVGHFQDQVGERQKLQQLFESAGVECECPRSLLEARWRKMAWNFPFNGLTLLYGCETDGIVSDAARRTYALALARNIVTVGNLDLQSRGIPARIEDDWADLQLSRTDTMGAYAPSTLVDARLGRELETDMMFLEPARRATRLGANVPALLRFITELRERGIVK